MSKKTNKILFYGQHEDERILYVVQPHPWAKKLKLIQLAVAVGLILIAFFSLAGIVDFVRSIAIMIGIALAAIAGVGGYLSIHLSEGKNVAYITDRRVVRFRAVTPLTQASRTLSWDEAVKVKTFSPNMFLRMANVGTVIIHAKSTVMATNMSEPTMVADDDVELSEVYYYQDLGNYIDKILYLYKRKPQDLETVKAFVPKPKGQRD